jgi:TRAP-type C4-dicarboxylate transport system substrate-binding protein
VKRRRLLTAVLAISLLALALPLVSGCEAETNGETPTNGGAPAKVYELRMQHSWGAAENHFFQQYADIVEEMTDGRIKIAVFSDGEIVTWDELSDAVASGVLDMGHTHPDYYEGVVPEGFLESAPYLWRTLDEEMAVIYEYGVGDIYTEALEETFGYHVIGFQPDDFGALMFTKEINSLADMEGCVINVLDPTASILAELAGASATYMGPEEIYTALATGVLDAVEYGGAKAMSEMGFHDVAKYFVEPHHQIAYFPFYFINADLWDELPADLQAILEQAVYANAVYMRAFYAEGEQKALAMMKGTGVKVCTLPDEDVEAIFQKALEWLENDYASISPRCARAADACLEALRDFGRID